MTDTEYASYGWVVTKDVHPYTDLDGESWNRKGRMGPHNISPEIEARLKKGEGFKCRTLDDDGNITYYYRIIFDDFTDPIESGSSEYFKCFVTNLDTDEEAAFGPLWDFGAPDAGDTELQYRDKNGVYASL